MTSAVSGGTLNPTHSAIIMLYNAFAWYVGPMRVNDSCMDR